MSIRMQDVMLYGGGECLQRFGVPFWRMARSQDVAATFSRSSVGAVLGKDGTFREASANRLRPYWIDSDGDGELDRCALLLEDGSGNELLDSSDIDPDDANWAENAAWTQASATSVIDGGVTQKFTNNGSTAGHAVTQLTPNLISAPVVAWLIIEQGDATTTTIGINDQTAGDWVVQATYTWATGAIAVTDSGVGSSVGARARTLMDPGPNGGKVVLIEVYAEADNAGNSGRFFIYPTGTGTNSESVYLHHAQYEEESVGVDPAATSPIVTAGSSDTRANETLYLPWRHAPMAAAYYMSFREWGTVLQSTRRIFEIGYNLVHPHLRVAQSSDKYAVSFSRTSSNQEASVLSTAPSIDEDVELVAELFADGSVQLHQWIDGTFSESSTRSSAIGLPPAWASGYERVYLGGNEQGFRGLNPLYSFLAVRGTGYSISDFRNAFPYDSARAVA